MNILNDYTVRMIFFGGLVLGMTGGLLGVFAVLRRQGLMGDVMSHAALPGLCIAFILAGGKAPFALMAGAAVSAWLASWVVLTLASKVGIDQGAALASTLSGFFGIGVALLSWIQRQPGASAGGLESFLFGQAASLVQEQVVLMAAVGGLACLAALLLVHPYRVMAFDPQFAQVSGIPVNRLNGVFMFLLILAIVVGLNAVGVVLMSAMLVAPAAAARQWCRSLGAMLLTASLLGGLSGGVGGLVSTQLDGAPTGPVIVLILGLVVAGSLFFGSYRGLLSRKAAR